MPDVTTFRERQARMLSGLDERVVVVVSCGSDVRWLTGFTGSNGLFLVSRSASILLTDGRYEEQAAQEASVDSVRIVRGALVDAVPDILSGGGPVASEVLFQADDMTFERATRLKKALSEIGTGARQIGDHLAELRSVKDAGELMSIRGALKLSEKVMSEIPGIIRPGVTERELAAEIDYRHRMAGADGPAFDTIVAFGERAALPHARPGDARLEPGDCVLLDFGCIVNGYRSDITRTMVLGKAPDGFEAAYEAVERALMAAQEAVVPDMNGQELDAVARRLLERDGLADRFAHSLGHGVGLDIHERPRVSFLESSRIREGAVITIEPGVYLPGRFGIRIENMVSVEQSGARVLNGLETGLVVL